MPTYEYQHTEAPADCPLGARFDWTQSIKDDALAECPECGRPVTRLIGAPSINTPKTDSDLKSMGFTKLVRRDKGVYENVTATGGESRVMEAGKPETIPHVHKRVED